MRTGSTIISTLLNKTCSARGWSQRFGKRCVPVAACQEVVDQSAPPSDGSARGTRYVTLVVAGLLALPLPSWSPIHSTTLSATLPIAQAGSAPSGCSVANPVAWSVGESRHPNCRSPPGGGSDGSMHARRAASCARPQSSAARIATSGCGSLGELHRLLVRHAHGEVEVDHLPAAVLLAQDRGQACR